MKEYIVEGIIDRGCDKMGYGITDRSQLIDVDTIRSGCESYKRALSFFTEGGNQVISAGHSCNAKALSVDGSSFETDIVDIGNQIIALEAEYSSYAEAVYAQAVQVYNAQVAELNEYNRWLAQQRAAQAQQQYR